MNLVPERRLAIHCSSKVINSIYALHKPLLHPRLEDGGCTPVSGCALGSVPAAGRFLVVRYSWVALGGLSWSDSHVTTIAQ